MIERYYAMQHIQMFTSHPPKVPFSLVPYTFSFIQVPRASQLPPPKQRRPRGKPVPQACNPSGKPQKGSWPGFGPKELFPKDPRRPLSLQGSKPPKSQNLAPKGSWPGFGPKEAVSQGSQKAILIAGLQATKVPKAGF